MQEKHLYKFGEFVLNAEDHSLTRNGDTVPVTPKMFDLLLVLVQHPGRVLGKDFLLKSVWPDSFVEEGNITFNIRQLRKALDDNVQSPQFIETIPRRGYRFLAPVEATMLAGADGSDPTDVSQSPESTPTSTKRPLLIATIAALLLLAGAIGLGGWLMRGRASSSLPIFSTPFEEQKLSTDGSVFHIAISPDGKNVVYTHRVNGKQSIWLRQLETGNNVPIVPASDDFYGGLVVAPDGNNIYFVRGIQSGPQLAVYRMPIFGGVPQKITEGTQGWISVSAKGDKLSYVRCPYTDDDYCSLYISDIDGQNEKRLVTRPRPFRIGDNKISPDGKTVAFAVGQSRTSSNQFQAMGVDVDTGVERELTPEKFFNISYFAWLPDNSGFLMTAMQLPERNYRIWSVTPSGQATRHTSDAETYSRLDLDAAGKLLVSTQVEPDFRLRVYDIANPTAQPRVFGDATTVSFVPDGRLFFSSLRTGNADIWSLSADGNDLRQLTNDPAAESVPLLSPDMKAVFFESDRTGVDQIWRMETDGTNQRQVTTDEGGLPLRVSPDGQWLYYRSSLRGVLRRIGVNGGPEEDVMKNLGRHMVLSADLKHIAYSQRVGPDTVLMVASIPDGQIEKTWRINSAPNLAHLTWSSDGTYLAYILTDDAREIGGLWYQPLNENSPRQIFDLSGDEIAEVSAFSLSDDAKRFAVIKGNWKHDAVLIRGLK